MLLNVITGMPDVVVIIIYIVDGIVELSASVCCLHALSLSPRYLNCKFAPPPSPPLPCPLPVKCEHLPVLFVRSELRTRN